MRLQLPEEKNITFPKNLESSPHIYYSRMTGPFYQGKLRMLCEFLPEPREKNILEIGFGSGVMLKELASHFEKVYALDIHDRFLEVQQMINKENLPNIQLVHHNIFEEPFLKEKDFDYVVSSSVFEHIPEDKLEQGIKNIYTVLKEGGHFLIGFPLKSFLMTHLFHIYQATYQKFNKGVYGFNVHEDHPSGEKEIVPLVKKYFQVRKIRYFLNDFIKLYMIIQCQKEEKSNEG